MTIRQFLLEVDTGEIMFRIFLINLILFSWTAPALADVFKIEDNILYYDTENSDITDEVSEGHEEELLTILKEHHEIDTLILNSGGGFVYVANEMADLVIDAKLNTHVEFSCESSCATIFLAGTKRSLALGGKIGFHKSYWEADSIKEYYESKKETEGWSNIFDFASWMYEDTQSEIFTEFEHLIERGVTPKFAIETLRAGSDGMWYPRRSKLFEGGVLTD
jgi:hypothetical protein